MFNVDSRTLENLKFLQMIHIDKYKKEMGNLDLSGQLHGKYPVDYGSRIEKSDWSYYVGF